MIEASIKDTATGEVRTYTHPNYMDTPNSAGQDNAGVALYDWLEGNASCDCNRHAFFRRAGNEEVWPFDMPCGGSRYELVALTVDGEALDLTGTVRD